MCIRDRPFSFPTPFEIMKIQGFKKQSILVCELLISLHFLTKCSTRGFDIDSKTSQPLSLSAAQPLSLSASQRGTRTHGRTDARTHGRTDAPTHGRTDARTDVRTQRPKKEEKQRTQKKGKNCAKAKKIGTFPTLAVS